MNPLRRQMSRKQSKEDKDYREGVKSYNEYMKLNRKLEKMGMHGTDYYVKRVEILEAKVKKLEEKLKSKRKVKR
jgi:uncharacterized membrane protein